MRKRKQETNEQPEYAFRYQTYEELLQGSDMDGTDRTRRGFRTFSLLLAALLAITFLGFAVYGAYSVFFGEHGIAIGDSRIGTGEQKLPALLLEDRPQNEQSNRTDDSLTCREIVRELQSSLVGVTAYGVNMDLEPLAEASGIVFDSSGYIITNASVVENAAGIKVVLHNGEEYAAAVIGKDTQTDLAVIKISAEHLQPATFGDSEQCETGETVFTLGNPSNVKRSGTIAQGILSGISETYYSVSGNGVTLLHTDAAIHIGNSGGPLVNAFGQIVGINSARMSQKQGAGIAIAIRDAQEIVDQLMEHGKVSNRPIFGITEYHEIDSVLSAINEIPTGIYIAGISQRSDLIRSGVTVGDIITAINDRSLTNGIEDVRQALTGLQAGDPVKLQLYRMSDKRVYSVNILLMEND